MTDLNKLAAQGRAYSASRPWETDELDALILLEKQRSLSRPEAADYVRNGILTLEAFDRSTEAKFKPKTLDTAAEEAEKVLKDNDFARPKKVVKKGKK